MAPRLNPSQHKRARAMILVENLSIPEIAAQLGCHERTVSRLRRKVRLFGDTRTPTELYRTGRPNAVTPLMIETLRKELAERPDMYRDEMSAYLERLFRVQISKSSIGRALRAAGMTRKKIRRVAAQHDPDLLDYYMYRLHSLGVQSYHMIFVDESGSDTRDGHRAWGWADIGVTPVQTRMFSRGRRWQILPAYTQEGIMLSRVYDGSTTSAIFEDFVAQLLQHCGRFPEPRSVLIWDNASWHMSEKIQQMCDEAGVLIVPLPPYTPWRNPIEEFFAELKACIKASWYNQLFLLRRDFHEFLRNCLEDVGNRVESAEGHFRHAGYGLRTPR
ncbi:spc7 protein [Purpureocillium lavendulum]|uniref:Spc7 protein n=1 Tax=Purpureocillium lavendulum TaxID=1247861 RepID=A0AB34FU16_9HYPO|nr:spc7 protein [Purpureocillium lavendulum]